MKRTCLLLVWPLAIQACLSCAIHAQGPQGTGSIKATAANLENPVRKQGLENGSVIVWAPSGCNVCEGFRDRVVLPNGERPFIERAYGTSVAAEISPMREGDSLVVAVAVSADREAVTNAAISISRSASPPKSVP